MSNMEECKRQVGEAVWRERKACAEIIAHAWGNPRLLAAVEKKDFFLFSQELTDILFDRPDPRQLEIPFVRP